MNFEPTDNRPASVATTMQLVLLALLPGGLVFCYQNGWGSIINIVLATTSAIGFEALALRLRKRPMRIALSDYSAIVTAVLIALCLPPLLPWWIPVLSAGFAILLAKHAFGGIGNNLFNPAMVGYAIVLISFPTEMSLWLLQPDGFATSLSDSLRTVFNGGISAQPMWDALTGATALDQHRDLLLQNTNSKQIASNTQGLFGARQSEWINLGYFIGGIWLLKIRVINWHIPFSFLAALLACTLLHNMIASNSVSIPLYMFGGATMLCAFFISTDPVSAATSNRGRIIYAGLTGFLVYLIRSYGAFPDGVAFAVLLANCTAPAIDRLDSWFTHTNEK